MTRRPPRARFAAFAVVAVVIIAAVGGPVDVAAHSPRGDASHSTASRTPQLPTTPNGSTGTEETTATAPEVPVRDGSLPVDAGWVFARVQRILGTDVRPPTGIRVIEEASAFAGDGNAAAARTPQFFRLVGVTSEPALNESERANLENGYTTPLGAIVLYPGVDPTAATVAPLLAHEYVHYVQFVQKRAVDVSADIDTGTTDGQFVRRSVLEGAAVYATDAFVARYAEDSQPNSAWYPELQRKLVPGSLSWYGNTAYIAGHRYVADRLDSPRHLKRIYEDPPTTSEQVLHGYDSVAEPPADLSVEMDTAGRWRFVGTDRLGEAFVRAVLANGVSVERATRAAAGWGNDTLRVFRAPDRPNSSYAWVLRWDDAENASEFEAAFRDYLDAHGSRLDARGNGLPTDTWRMRGRTVTVSEPTERITVVAFGPRSFVDRLRASATGERVVLQMVGVTPTSRTNSTPTISRTTSTPTTSWTPRSVARHTSFSNAFPPRGPQIGQ